MLEKHFTEEVNELVILHNTNKGVFNLLPSRVFFLRHRQGLSYFKKLISLLLKRKVNDSSGGCVGAASICNVAYKVIVLRCEVCSIREPVREIIPGFAIKKEYFEVGFA